jgi:hypothetical protein
MKMVYTYWYLMNDSMAEILILNGMNFCSLLRRMSSSSLSNNPEPSILLFTPPANPVHLSFTSDICPA